MLTRFCSFVVVVVVVVVGVAVAGIDDRRWRILYDFIILTAGDGGHDRDFEPRVEHLREGHSVLRQGAGAPSQAVVPRYFEPVAAAGGRVDRDLAL